MSYSSKVIIFSPKKLAKNYWLYILLERYLNSNFSKKYKPSKVPFLGKNHKLVGNIVSGPASLYACRNLRGQNQSILLYMSVTKLLVSFLVVANLDNLRLSGVNFKVYWNHRSITPRWTKHIRLLLGQNPLPWWVKCACASDRWYREKRW